ncbi:MAG: Hpt domain-containing protein [Deltaproteobacteria bacterium]|nr:Hpt domain-containing protein [Deltaproteobacteria bacterium]MBW2659181.1 Hpt domain-containing protein [Deltaproteobacteria bacterium]
MEGDQSIIKIKAYLSGQFHLADEQIESMIPGFITTLHCHMEKLETAVADKDPDMVRRAAHTIKGALLNLGLDECARMAALLEEKGKSGDRTTEFKPLIDGLHHNLAPVFAFLFPG